MEDKELQELFAAKRTTEANRRRQEELRHLIEAQNARPSRPLWPVWTGAAAAAIALLLLTLPALFGHETETPSLVAEAEVPEIVDRQPSQPSPAGQASPAKTTRRASTPSPSTETIEEPVILHQEEPVMDSPVEESPVEAEPIEETFEETLETVAPAPRILRRQSTIIACTEGCSTPEGNDSKTSRNVQINFFNNDNYADATIYSIPIKK
ncbi:MAG: hypothetical protein K6E96_06315 [Bacteroidales bacterium]|nr:hypothetical protein [Bacteroidales bacterium]